MKRLFVLIKAPPDATAEHRDAIATAFQYAMSNGGVMCVAHDLRVDVYKVDTSKSGMVVMSEIVSSKISDGPGIGPSVPPPPPPPPNG